MYKIAICDDEEKILEDISEVIKQEFERVDFQARYFAVNDPKKLIDILQRETIDILFLDIDMPHISGMDIAKYILEKGYKTILIFVTSYDSLVYQTFQYQPLAFIRKNYFNTEIAEVAARAVKAIENKIETLNIKTDNQIVKIKICDIKYFEGDLNYVNLYTSSGQYRFRETLVNLEKELSIKGFIRIHKGYLINEKFVYVIKGNEIQLEDGTLIPIGRSYSEYVKKKIMETMR